MSRRVASFLVVVSLVAGCVPIEESTPPPRTVATSAPRLERDELSASGGWNRAPQRLESTSQFSVSLERRLTNNTLDCDLGVQFESDMLLDNQFIDNRIRGQMQNIEF